VAALELAMVNVLDERRITSLDWESLLQGVNENRSDHYTMQELRVVGLVSVAACLNRFQSRLC
jgi:hypothetical protein